MLTNGQSFQNASLAAIDRSQDDLILSFENVYIDGALRFAKVQLHGVTEIRCDDEVIEQLELMEDDGEVVEFAADATGLSIVVSWVNFKDDTEITQSYRIACGSIDTIIGAISPDSPMDN
jgi:hypothetical protein